ncbi:hypothetical protein CNMCM6936_007433 [Aspergillus lentulus]|uniref:Uncharacterized protein n=1 Tax=Aspergillus lentulus TaxID=293939 RepID=A0AAN6BPP0_ASPLE|nr:hypothetical protein CNMCM6069_006457 [Aspergillus lentulus]KAF4165713.1 hypothetical protein CNMCM6936_007433 [Aspergillus lentulus]KAF4176211.1 hypothetical protein CNMCM8060_006495 [Aspergillus lentulus]KAF4184283.1 hypothetical protein CNMCM7927_008189 [Aspergillus lentulus]KAF4193960.1 hypothetical protein CNMCM8694_008202 [Aspergillus lentulus]
MILSMSFTRQPLRLARWSQIRTVSTLEGNPHIYIFSNKPQSGSHTLSLLSSEPVNPKTAIGVTSKLPPSTDSFRENPNFLKILQEVVSEYGHKDPDAISQAQVMVSTSGANISSGGVLMTGQGGRRRRESKDSSGGASGQGGVGSAGRGGWIHLSDSRRPPEPEDIFGSLEVDANGKFVGDNGNYQPSGTYRIVTRDGILGLSPFLREKLVQRLHELQ